MNPRPKSITVLAVIGIILGLFGVMCAPFGILGIATQGGEVPLFLPGNFQSIPFPPALNKATIINGVIGFFVGLILLAGSLLSFPLKPMARTLMNTYAVLSILNNSVYSILQIILIYPELVSRIGSAMSDLPPGAIIFGAILGGVISMLCQMIYPVCVLVFYNNARAKMAFSGQAMQQYPVYTEYQQPPGGYQQGWPQQNPSAQNPWGAPAPPTQYYHGWPPPQDQPAAPPQQQGWSQQQPPQQSWPQPPQQPWQAPPDPGQPQYPPPGWPPPLQRKDESERTKDEG